MTAVAFKEACHSFAQAAAPHLPYIAALSRRFHIDPGS